MTKRNKKLLILAKYIYESKYEALTQGYKDEVNKCLDKLDIIEKPTRKK